MEEPLKAEVRVRIAFLLICEPSDESRVEQL